MSTVFTIGYSNQSAAEFDDLLLKYNIERVVDVRTRPNSRYHRFKREPLQERLLSLGIDYLYLGDELGGYPAKDELYTKGRVTYERVTALRGFRRGIKQVAKDCELYRLALMCAEEDPSQCHRHHLLASALMERGVQVRHIRRDGTAQIATAGRERPVLQLPLFEPVGEDLTWQSPKRMRL